jgi:hypothetical protein
MSQTKQTVADAGAKRFSDCALLLDGEGGDAEAASSE